MYIHTESVQFKADKKLIDFVDKKVGKLETYFDNIIEATVTLRLENSGQVRDKIAELKLHVPKESLFAKETHKTFEGAVESAVDNMKRQLKRYKEKMRNVRPE